MNYKGFLTENDLPFWKTCNCGGVFNECYKNHELDVEVRIRPKQQPVKYFVKLYDRQELSGVINNNEETFKQHVQTIIQKAQR